MNATDELFNAIRDSATILQKQLVNAPTSEWGVIFLLGQLSSQGGFSLVKGTGAFPDCVLEVHGTHLTVELEHRASQFIRHRHPFDGCDAVICWEKDADLPIPTLALRPFYPDTPTPNIATIDLSRKHPDLATIFEYLREWISSYGIPPKGVPVRSETNTLTFVWREGSLCSIQFCGTASNEYVRFRFYTSAFPDPQVGERVVQTFKDIAAHNHPHVNYSPSGKEERIDLYPEANNTLAQITKELDVLMKLIL